MRNYKYHIIFIILLTGRLDSVGQTGTAVSGVENVKCTYNYVNGRLSGNYVSFYSNGNKRSEGKLENGYRIGKWIVWDSTGRKRMERVYKNPFEFTKVFPAVPNEGPIPLLIENSYRLEYDTDGIVKYAVIKPENAVRRHKYWRNLEPVNNDILFKDNKILKIIFKLIKYENLVVYDTIDDRFTTVLAKENRKDLSNSEAIQLVGLELKEENIFDMNRLVSEYRIVGICPVVKINGQLQKLFWIYYPDIRKYLGKEVITNATDSKLKTFDDLFIFRYFSSGIIKTTFNNPMDRFLKNYPGITPTSLKAEQEAEELNIIESENNIWISLTK